MITKDQYLRLCAEHIRTGLQPFVERTMRDAYGDNWKRQLSGQPHGGAIHLDVQALTKTMIDQWNAVFGRALPPAGRTYAYEIKDWRNKVAHELEISWEDVVRYLDTAARLLACVGAINAAQVDGLKRQVYRDMFASEAVANPPPPAPAAPTMRPVRPSNTAMSPFTPQSHEAGAPDWRECVQSVGAKLGAALTRRSGRCAFSVDGAVGVCCIVSKEYPGHRYWWNLRQRQLDVLNGASRGYIVFACGTADTTIAIPVREFVEWLPTFNPKPGDDGDGWHIHILNEGMNWLLLQTGRNNRVDVSRYLV